MIISVLIWFIIIFILYFESSKSKLNEDMDFSMMEQQRILIETLKNSDPKDPRPPILILPGLMSSRLVYSEHLHPINLMNFEFQSLFTDCMEKEAM